MDRRKAEPTRASAGNSMNGAYKEANIAFAKPIIAELAKALDMPREERLEKYGTLGLSLLSAKLYDLLFWHND